MVRLPGPPSRRDPGRRITRRAVLLAGAAALVPAPRRLPAKNLAPGSSPEPPRVGGTLSLRTFPGGTTYEQALVAWNQKTRTDLQCWKIYYQEGEFGTGNDAQVQTMVDGDIQALISVKPSIKPSSSDRAALSTLLAGLQRRGLNARVCLWQEVGPKVMTAAQYHTYVRYYGPAIRQFYPLVFDAPGHVDPRVWKEYGGI